MQRSRPIYDVGICISKMAGKKKKESFCGHTFKYLENKDKDFCWSKAYSWYSDLPAEDTTSKHLKTIRLVKVGCIQEIFGVLELVLWCAKHFNASKRTIQVGENTIPPKILSPPFFQKMLRLPKPNKELKLP